jgi:hypothetical protein
MLCLWTLSIVLFLSKTQRFGDWILSPSSGKTYSDIGTSCVDWAHLSRFYHKTETESSVLKYKQDCVLDKTGRWVMFRNVIFILETVEVNIAPNAIYQPSYVVRCFDAFPRSESPVGARSKHSYTHWSFYFWKMWKCHTVTE